MIQRHHTEGGAYLWESCMEASAPPLPPCFKMVLNGLLGSILPSLELRGWQSRLLGLGVLALFLSLLLVTPERKPHMMDSIGIPIKLLKQLDLINIVSSESPTSCSLFLVQTSVLQSGNMSASFPVAPRPLRSSCLPH